VGQGNQVLRRQGGVTCKKSCSAIIAHRSVAYAVLRLEGACGSRTEGLISPLGPDSPTIENSGPTASTSSTENLARCRRMRRIRISTGAAANAIGGLPKPGEFGQSVFRMGLLALAVPSDLKKATGFGHFLRLVPLSSKQLTAAKKLAEGPTRQNHTQGGMPMKLPRRLFLHALAAEVFALRLVCRAAKAQDYPTRPEKLIVAYAAGHSMIGE